MIRAVIRGPRACSDGQPPSRSDSEPRNAPQVRASIASARMKRSLSPRPDMLITSAFPTDGRCQRHHGSSRRMRGLQREEKPFGPRKEPHRFQRLRVAGRGETDPARSPRGARAGGRCPGSPARPRWNGWAGAGRRSRPGTATCSPGRSRVCRGRSCAPRALRRRSSAPCLHARSARGPGICEERGEEPDGVGPAADAGDQRRRRRPLSRASCALSSLPITDWNSRTISGYGEGPSAEPRR